MLLFDLPVAPGLGLTQPPALPAPPPERRPAFLAGAVVFPALVLMLERALAHLAGEGLFSVTSAPLLMLITFAAPVCNFLAWRSTGARWNPALLAFALTVASYYSLALAPILPFALLAVIFLVGVLPFAPVISAVQGLYELHRYRLQPRCALYTALGAGLATLLLCTVELPGFFAREAIAAETPRSWWLTLPGTGAALDRACRGERRTPLELWLNPARTNHDACQLAYLASGRVVHADQPQWWDPFRGQTRTGTEIAAFRIASSQITAEADRRSSLQTFDWTLEFQNDNALEQEARLRIALPPQGVVHQASLWVNGVERQAAFGGTEAVQQAYQKVAVVQRRDPLLVTWAGRDQVFVQAFPVLPRQRMRIRLGIVAPLSEKLVTPYILDQNLGGTRHHVELRSAGRLQEQHVAALPVAFPVAGEAGSLAALDPLDPRWMFTGRVERTPLPSSLTVVVDGSAWMQPHAPALDAALQALRGRTMLRILLAAELPREVETLGAARFSGGVDNVPALVQALRQTPDGGRVLWIHGRQPHLFESTSAVERELQRDVRLWGYRVEAGANEVWNALARQKHVRFLGRSGDFVADLAQADASRTIMDRVPAAGAPRINSPAFALWAAAQDAAVAGRYRVVTEDVGAVVLETDQQYRENGLAPPPKAVTATPEPATWALMLGAVAVLAWRRHRARAVRAA